MKQRLMIKVFGGYRWLECNCHDTDLIGKDQKDHIREMFTKEAIANLKMTRDLNNMTLVIFEMMNVDFDINFQKLKSIQEKNDELSKDHQKDEIKMQKLIQSLKSAETQIEQLQKEVLETKQTLAVAKSALKRGSTASPGYIQTRNEVLVR
jgi:septal ring factor EnvC (AmiA/AmiB activator)